MNCWLNEGVRSSPSPKRWCPILAKQGWGTDKRRDDIDTRDLLFAGRRYRSVPHPSPRAKDGAPAASPSTGAGLFNPSLVLRAQITAPPQREVTDEVE